jgi:cell division protein FtsI/penicillin-binding protein 2
MKGKPLEKKLRIYGYVVIFLLALLGARLAVVQLFNNESYQTQAKENRIRLLPKHKLVKKGEFPFRVFSRLFHHQS